MVKEEGNKPQSPGSAHEEPWTTQSTLSAFDSLQVTDNELNDASLEAMQCRQSSGEQARIGAETYVPLPMRIGEPGLAHISTVVETDAELQKEIARARKVTANVNKKRIGRSVQPIVAAEEDECQPHCHHDAKAARQYHSLTGSKLQRALGPCDESVGVRRNFSTSRRPLFDSFFEEGEPNDDFGDFAGPVVLPDDYPSIRQDPKPAISKNSFESCLSSQRSSEKRAKSYKSLCRSVFHASGDLTPLTMAANKHQAHRAIHELEAVDINGLFALNQMKWKNARTYFWFDAVLCKILHSQARCSFHCLPFKRLSEKANLHEKVESMNEEEPGEVLPTLDVASAQLRTLAPGGSLSRKHAPVTERMRHKGDKFFSEKQRDFEKIMQDQVVDDYCRGTRIVEEQEIAGDFVECENETREEPFHSKHLSRENLMLGYETLSEKAAAVLSEMYLPDLSFMLAKVPVENLPEPQKYP